MPISARLLLPVCLAIATGGCWTPPTGGEYGRAEFAYDEGLFGCLFGCNASAPIAARANTFINVVNDEELPPFVVSSSDTGVLELIQNSGTSDASIRVISHAAGTAYLELEEPDGALIDRVELTVADVARIELGWPEIDSRLLMMTGGSGSLRFDLFDAGGAQLKGFGAVDYAAAGGLGETELSLESALDSAIVRAFAGSTHESLNIGALALGVGSIEVIAPTGAALSIPTEVVDASAVASIEVTDRVSAIGSIATMSATAFASDGEVIHSPTCAWALTSTSGTITIANEDPDSIQLDADADATGSVTCTIGSATGTGSVRFAPPEP